MNGAPETGPHQNRSASRFSVDPQPSGTQDNLGPVARARAIVAKRIAKAATKRSASREYLDGHVEGHGNGVGPGGEGTTDPVSLRNEFTEQLRLEEKQAEEIRLVAKELEHWRGRLVASKEAAEGRRAERHTFGDLLSTQDATSDDDIRRALQAINDTTEQLTVQASKDLFTSTPRHGVQPAPETDGHRLEAILGAPLYRALLMTTSQDTFAGLLLQYSWQACITNTASNMLQVFSLASPGMPETSDIDQAFSKASSTAEADECQPVYGHWRAMTHNYLRQNMEMKPDELQRRIHHYTHDAMSLCRLAAAMLFKNLRIETDWMRNQMQARVTLIMEGTWNLAVMIREDCVTKNYTVYQPQSGTPFDPTRMTVDDAIDAENAQTVVCTTRLGLVYSHKRGRDRGPTISDVLFLPAQVLTDNTVEDVIPKHPGSNEVDA